MDEAPVQTNQPLAKISYRRRRPIVLIGLVAAIILIASTVAVTIAIVSHKQTVTSTTNALLRSLADAQSKANFPLYYSTKLPAGFTPDVTTLQASIDLVSFSYNFAGGTIIATQQPRPRDIEEVPKTREFKTSIGPAYIADLNGHTTGFAQSDKTLIILSSGDKVSADQLQQMLMSLKPVN